MVKIFVATVLCFTTTTLAVRPVEPPTAQARRVKVDWNEVSFLQESQTGFGDDGPLDEDSMWNPLQEKSEHLEKTFDLLTQQRLKVQGAVSHEKLTLSKLESDLDMYRMMHKASKAQEEKLRHGQSESLLKMFHTMYEGSQASGKELEGSANAVEAAPVDEEPEERIEEQSTTKPEEVDNEVTEQPHKDEMGSPEKDELIRNVEEADSTGGTFTGSGMPVVDKEIDNKRDMNEVVSEIKDSKSPHHELTSHPIDIHDEDASGDNETEVEVADQNEDEQLGMNTHPENTAEENVVDESDEHDLVNSSVVEMQATHHQAHSGSHRSEENHKSKHHERHHDRHQHHGRHDKAKTATTTKPRRTHG